VKDWRTKKWRIELKISCETFNAIFMMNDDVGAEKLICKFSLRTFF
jgi:hypothetical protein